MANDLQLLRHAESVLLKKARIDAYNSSVHDTIRAKTAPVEKKSAARVNKMEKRCKSIERSHLFFTRVLPMVLLAVVLIGAVLFAANSLLSATLPVTPSTFVEKMRAYALEHVNSYPKLLMTENLKYLRESGRIAHFNDESFATDAYGFLAGGLIWATLAVLFVASMISSKTKKKLSDLVYVFDVLLILAFLVWLMIKTKTIIGVLVGVVWLAFTGIPLMWVCGMPLLLVYILLNVIVIAVSTAYDAMAKRHHSKVAPALEGTKRLRVKIAEEKAECKKQCDAIRKPYTGQFRYDTKNDSDYAALPSYLYDYQLVSQLLWAITNGYATTIPEARRFLDQKAENAAIRRALAENAAAARRAEQAARDAEAAARAPVDVNVTIYYK